LKAGSVMDIAIGSLRARNTPMLKVEGLYWILDQNLRPAIVAGYGTNDPEKMSSIHQIIKFHVRGVPRRRVPIFNVVSTIDDYAVKHTRVATPSVVLYDEKIPASTIKAARNYLEGQYIDYVLDVAEAFRGRGFEVPPVAQYEFIAEKVKKKAKVVKAKAIKSNKRMRFITEEDDEDGPVRCLTPIKKQVRFQPERTDSIQSERADSIMGEAGRSPDFTYKDSADGLTLVVDPDTPIDSVEDRYGLSTPISIENTGRDSQNDWSAAFSAKGDLFEPC
jgi:hypothetical protein